MLPIRPIPASRFNDIDDKIKELLRQNGGLPVNDIFIQVMDALQQIILLYGSYGSGKSVAAATKLLKKCLTTPYFKCMYGRKIKDKVRESCFDTICDTIEDNHWEKYFSYNRKPNSNMYIQCVNGNTFIPFGCDDPMKIKSIKDPTDIWAEELDQFSHLDFATLYTRLRTQKAQTQFIGTFNTESVFDEHWIKKTFFNEDEDPDNNPFSDTLKILANYYHNFFIDQEAYYEKLKIASGGNERRLEAIAFGAWGVSENNSPWLYAFDYEKHIADNVNLIASFPIYLSFDFNRDPCTCTLWQFSPSKGMKESFIHCIDEFGGTMQLRELCMQIKTRYPYSIFYVTGDSSGNKGDVVYSSKHDTAYSVIRSTLGLGKKQMQPNTFNLLHENSRMLMNVMFNSYPNLKISSRCKNLIRDIEIAEVDEDSGRSHQLRKDREKYKMDFFDNMRYFFQKYFHEFAQSVYFKMNLSKKI